MLKKHAYLAKSPYQLLSFTKLSMALYSLPKAFVNSTTVGEVFLRCAY
jgi:hypothetical protein